MSGFNMKVTPEIMRLTDICYENSQIPVELYGKHDVKRGLRDLNGQGVLAGLTKISNVQAYRMEDGKKIPCAGELSYRGINVEDLTDGWVLRRSPTCSYSDGFRIRLNWRASGSFCLPNAPCPATLSAT